MSAGIALQLYLLKLIAWRFVCEWILVSIKKVNLIMYIIYTSTISRRASRCVCSQLSKVCMLRISIQICYDLDLWQIVNELTRIGPTGNGLGTVIEIMIIHTY